MSQFDIDWVRDQFALPETTAFFDNAGGSFTLKRVIDRVAQYMRETPVQLGASHALSQLAGQRQRESIAALTRLFNARSGKLVLGPSSSALTDRLARAMRGQLRAGDRIIVTELDHESNISPWLRLKDHGVEIDLWTLNRDSLRPELDDLRALITDRTRLVACTHCTNVMGDVLPIEAIRSITRSAGVRFMVDGVACAPHRQVDLQALGVDFYVVSLYKLFGPHIGLLYGRDEALLELDNINLSHLSKSDIPYKLQPGGTCYELVYGAAGIMDYLDEVPGGFAAIERYERELGNRFVEGLQDMPIRWHGQPQQNHDRLPIFSFDVPGRSSKGICEALDQRDIAARYGHFHAKRLVEALGLDSAEGVVRVSLAHYNSVEEIDRLLAALHDIL